MDKLEHIKQFIKSHNIMVLATCAGDQPHACTVFYVTDDATTLYFKSYAVALHSKNLISNQKISIAIYDKESSPFGNKQGVQILGTAQKITDLQEAVSATELYINTFKSPREKFYPIEDMIKEDAKSSMYKVVVEKVKMLDSVNHVEPNEYIANK